jgi:xylose isomerase
LFRPLWFEGVQFHGDDVVPGMDSRTSQQLLNKAAEVKAMLANLIPESALKNTLINWR